MLNDWRIFSKYRNECYGIATILIIIYHYFLYVVAGGPGESGYLLANWYVENIGSIGVEWFLFLSGISLYFSIINKNTSTVDFYFRRFRRVLPVYLFIGSIFWLVMCFLNDNGIGSFIFNVSFLSLIVRGRITFWYIFCIILCYSLYPIVYRVLLVLGKQPYISLVVLFSASVVVNLISRMCLPSLYANTSIVTNRFTVFVMGCWAGKKVYDRCSFRWLDGVLLNIGIVLLPFRNTRFLNDIIGMRISVCFISFTALFYIVLMLSLISKYYRFKLLKKIGDLSLELYLSHVAIKGVMEAIGVDMKILKNYFFCIILSVLFSVTWSTFIQKSVAKKGVKKCTII